NPSNRNFLTLVSPAGDVNGDGYSDVLFADPYYTGGGQDDGGVIYLYLGAADGPSTTPSWTKPNLGPSPQIGSIAPAGDVNGDGFADIIFSSDRRFFTDQQVLIYYGNPNGLSN